MKKELRLLSDITNQLIKTKNENQTSTLIKILFDIDVSEQDLKRIPSTKQIMFKKVIESPQGNPKLVKVVKYQFRANVQKV